MSIAKKILGVRALKEKGDFDMLHTIDKAILSSSRSYFNTRTATAYAKALIEALSSKDRKQYLLAFAKLAGVMYAPEKTRSGKVHPSRLAYDCERRMYYEMSDTPTSDATGSGVSAQLQRTFDLGTWIHSYLQILMLQEGVAEDIEVRVEDLSLEIDGRGDAVTVELNGRKYLVEIKSINDRGFQEIKKNNRAKPEHVNQASTYAAILKLDWLLFLYFNKNTSEILQIHTPTDMKSFSQGVKKIKRVQKAVDEMSPPDRDCANAHTKQALNCEYCTLCFKS